MSDSVIDLNPHFDGRRGKVLTRSCILGGFLIESEEGRQWFERICGVKLAANHSQDLSVVIALQDDLEKYGVHEVRLVTLIDPCHHTYHKNEPSTDPAAWDFLVVTYIEPGPFDHDEINGCEYVVDKERRPLPGVKEAKVRVQLKELFGIDSPGYKSIYSDMYYPWLVR